VDVVDTSGRNTMGKRQKAAVVGTVDSPGTSQSTGSATAPGATAPAHTGSTAGASSSGGTPTAAPAHGTPTGPQ
jgi:hypothetical protein